MAYEAIKQNERIQAEFSKKTTEVGGLIHFLI